MKKFALLGDECTAVRIVDVYESDARQMQPMFVSLWLGAAVEVLAGTEVPELGTEWDWDARAFRKGES